jgi:hypothetical protein
MLVLPSEGLAICLRYFYSTDSLSYLQVRLQLRRSEFVLLRDSS